MRKTSKILISLFVFSLMLGGSCLASDQIVKINDLIEHTKSYDGQSVTVQGEAIGEALERGDYVWVNINDGSSATGIWMQKSDSSKIQTYGDYKHKGDTLKITGVFSRACAQHGGDVDIHCTDIEVVEQGHVIQRGLPTAKIIVACCSVLAAAALVLTFFRLWGKAGHSIKEIR